MKRASFRPGFAELRGNISGKQKLQYAENNNPAYEGPVGRKNYARNYQASVIISKRASDGLTYFSVRTKTCNHLTRKAKKAMAAMGATGAIIGAIFRNKTTAIAQLIETCWLQRTEAGDKRSFRKYLTDNILPQVKGGVQDIRLPGTSSTAQIKNPWYDSTQTEGIEVSNEVLAKFWPELSDAGINFFVDGIAGIATSGEDFNALIGDQDKNILGLTTEPIGINAYVKMNGSFLLDSSAAYVIDDDHVVANGVYSTTQIAPQE